MNETHSFLWCREKLTSQSFFDRMLHIRSIMPYADLERIPMALDVMRQLVQEEPLEMFSRWKSAAKADAISKLCTIGQLVLTGWDK